MVEYIYFVKCPECEDEHFDFFDDAKAHALGCLTRKPIITQTEVCRNDFGECTDHTDLGTVWSWEDEMSDEEFQKPISLDCNLEDFDEYDPESDAEFLNLDNDIETIIVKPVPDAMSIEDLVESMEENEDWVECKWCEDTFPKEDCEYEVSLGYLCPQCIEAIESRGEELTFRESLEEAAPKAPKKYKYIGQASKAEIIKRAREIYQERFPNTYFDPFKEGAIKVSYEVATINRYTTSKTDTTGYIIDFIINDDNTISVLHQSNRNESDITEKPLDMAIHNAFRGTYGKTVLTALRDAIKDVNAAHTPSIGVQRVQTSLDNLAEHPEIAEELKKHIKNIQYIIPLTQEYSETFEVDKNDVPLTKEVINKLNRLYDEFMGETFAEKALKIKDMVKNRPSTQDTNYNILHSWGKAAKVTFDIPIKQLSEEAQMFIASTKIRGSIAADDTDRTVTNYRLPTALIKYFGNNPVFYNEKENISEAFDYNPKDETYLTYENFTIEVQGPMKDVDDWDTDEVTDDFEYPVSNDDLATTIWEQFITEEDVPAEFGSLAALEEDDNLWQEFLKKHFEDLVDKYNKELLDYYEDEARTYFEEHYEYDSGYDADRMYDEYRDRMLFDEAVTQPVSNFTGSKADLKKYLGYSEETIAKYGAGPDVPEIPKGASFEGSDPQYLEDYLTYDKIQYDFGPNNPDAPLSEFGTVYGKNFEYEADIVEIIMYLWYMCLTEEDFGDQTREEVAATSEAFDEYFKKNYDKLFKKYYEYLLDAFYEKAAKKFEEDDRDRREWERESLETAVKLIDCPECGDAKCFDQETGICNTCGFH